MTTTVAAGIIILFAILGLKKGLLGSVLDLVAVIVTYLGIVFLTRPVAGLIESQGWVSGMAAYLVAPIAILIAVGLSFQIVGIVARRRMSEDTPKFRLSGAMVNALSGIFYAAFVVWGILFFQGVKNLEGPAAPKTVVESLSGKLVGTIGGAVLKGAIPEERVMTPAATHILEDPARGIQNVQRVMDNPRLAHVLSDEKFQELLRSGEVGRVEQDQRFQSLFADPDLAAAFEELGLTGDPEQDAAFRAYLAETLTVVFARLHRLQEDPEVVAIFEDPDFRQALESRDLVRLMKHPRMSQLLERIMAEGEVPDPPQREGA